MSETDPIRWGIAGSGKIARRFAADIRHADGARLVAVSSRDAARARAFAASCGNIAAFGSLREMAAAPETDAIYIASPNNAHLSQALEVLEHGKALLIEKPLTADLAEARTLAEAARKAGVFVMEAMWSRYLPAVRAARDMIRSGRIGRIVRLDAELAWKRSYDPASRSFDRTGGGGSLHDIGVYPISLCRFLTGEPDRIDAVWRAAPNGRDIAASIGFRIGKAEARLACGFDRDGANRMVIEGTSATIVLGPLFIKAEDVMLFASREIADRLAPAGSSLRERLIRKTVKHLPLPGVGRVPHVFPGSGLQFEIAAASNAIRAGLTEEPDCRLADSIRTLEIIDGILSQPPARG